MHSRLVYGLLSFCIGGALLAAQAPAPTGRVSDPGVVTTSQSITPAGVQSTFDGRVYGVAFGAGDDDLWVLTGRTKSGTPNLYRLDSAENRVRNSWQLSGTPALQGLVIDPVRKSPLVGITVPPGAVKNRPGGAVQLLEYDGTSFVPTAVDLGLHLAGAPALARGGANERAVLPLVFNNALAVVDLKKKAATRIETGGIAPFGAAISQDGRSAWVSNWGGRWPESGDVTLPTGFAKDADRVVVDGRGIASTGTIVRIDLDAAKVTHTLNVGLHPTAMVWDEARQRLFVANANSDSISVVDTATQSTASTMQIAPFGLALKGVSPTALAVAPDGNTLYVALGGFNAIAVVSVPGGTIRGLIPTAWYPNQIVLNRDGTKLAIATLLGQGSGWQNETKRRYVHAYRGTVAVVDVPDSAHLASYTTAVAENNHVASARQQLASTAAKATTALPVPARAGDPSLIEHVIYIIKENRTYDQLFGDLGKGNGDPSLVMFGADVAPNHRRLATDFVLLDNFYATGGNSGDGHQWVTQANETSYALWPGYVGRSYPFDGTDPITYSSTGFLWDLARARGKTVAVYGEYAGRLDEDNPVQRTRLLERWREGSDFTRDWSITAPLAPLNAILAKNYPSYSTAIPDVIRAQIFLKDLNLWVQQKKMPNLVLIQLPSDHTRGASPDQSTPKAMVADNDLALGQIVEALSKTEFWPKMAIFVVEDDAQNGVDHVDGHRTVALAISPYIRRGTVDSTFYAHQSMLKTIELMLGLPTMSLFDLIATDMRASFTTTADVRPYVAVQPKQSLFERNPKVTALSGPMRKAALDSRRMRFDTPDAAPTERLNRIVWGMVKGWNTPYPAVRRGAFSPLSIDVEDDERERRER